MVDQDNNIYDDNQAESMEEQDEIDEVEEGFMKGYEEGEKIAKCAQCKKVLEDNIVESEINGDTFRFCSEECAEKFRKK